MQFGGYSLFAVAKFIEVAPFFFYPVRIVMTLFPIIPGRMAEFPVPESVIYPGLGQFA